MTDIIDKHTEISEISEEFNYTNYTNLLKKVMDKGLS